MNSTWNLSNYNQESQLSYVEVVLFAGLVSLVAIVDIIGNTLVVVTVLFEKRMRRCAFHMLMVALAISDMGNILFSLIEWVEILTRRGPWWLAPSWLCTTSRYGTVVCLYFSIFVQVAICFERFLVICYPLHARRLMTMGSMRATVVSLCLSSIILATPYLQSRVVRSQCIIMKPLSSIFFSQQLFFKYFKTMEFFLFYVAPSLIFVGVTLRVTMKLRRRIDKLARFDGVSTPAAAASPRLTLDYRMSTSYFGNSSIYLTWRNRRCCNNSHSRQSYDSNSHQAPLLTTKEANNNLQLANGRVRCASFNGGVKLSIPDRLSPMTRRWSPQMHRAESVNWTKITRRRGSTCVKAVEAIGRRGSTNIQSRKETIMSSSTMTISLTSIGTGIQQGKANYNSWNPMAMMAACFGVYFICYSPVQILYVSYVLMDRRLIEISYIAVLSLNLMMSISAACNPIIYAMFSARLRRRFLSLLRCRLYSNDREMAVSRVRLLHNNGYQQQQVVVGSNMEKRQGD